MWGQTTCLICLMITAHAQDQSGNCVTLNGSQGTCIPIRECEQLASLIRNDPSTANVDLVQRSQCAFLATSAYPRVCCPNSTPTPDEHSRKVTGGHPNLDLLPSGECGLETGSRILGGTVTALDEYPWTALLEFERTDGSRTFGCGGVLINNQYVLTAAHCMTRYLKKNKLKLVNIRLGEHNIETREDCTVPDEIFTTSVCADPPLDFGIEQEIPHPNYTTNRHHYNDIALVRLSSKVPDINTDYIKTICVPTDDQLVTKDFAGSKLIAAGWGKTGDHSGKNSPVKQKVTLTVVPNADCVNQYKPVPYRIHVTENQLCAGGRRDMDACGGDSGGPLMGPVVSPPDFNPRYHVIGIVSYGPDCKIQDTPSDEPWIPGVYTRVASYRDWILDQLRP